MSYGDFLHVPELPDAGYCTFSGRRILSESVNRLTAEEIEHITRQLHAYVAEQGGMVDYIQKFERKTPYGKQRIFCIDMTEEQKKCDPEEGMECWEMKYSFEMDKNLTHRF